jgi:hypothetical protein
MKDKECLRAVFAALCRGVRLADKDKQESFGMVSRENADTPTALLNVLPVQPETQLLNQKRGSKILELKRKTTVSHVKQTTRKMSSAVPINFNSSKFVSPESGVGIPTFAILSAELRIQSMADFVIHCIVNELNSPLTDGLHLKSTFSEMKEFTKVSQHVLNNCGVELSMKNSIHAFHINRLRLITMIEQPYGLEKLVLVTVRDFTTKSSWIFNLEYLEHEAAVVRSKSSYSDDKRPETIYSLQNQARKSGRNSMLSEPMALEDTVPSIDKMILKYNDMAESFKSVDSSFESGDQTATRFFKSLFND